MKFKIFFSFFTFVFSVGISWGILFFSSYVNPYLDVCQLVYKNIYLNDSEELQKFYAQCLRESKKVTPWTNKSLMIRSLNYLFSELKVSHLQIFDENESNKIWKGDTIENGIQSEFIDGSLVVLSVDKGSPADLAHIEMGDQILTINGESPNESDAQLVEGNFEIEQNNQINVIHLKPVQYVKDDSMKVSRFSSKTGILLVPSFRKDFFSRSEIERVVNELQPYSKIILDLRENTGGNFVSGLRLLSVFMCGEQEVGILRKSLKNNIKESVLSDTLDDGEQIRQMSDNTILRLRTFSDYPCLSTPLNILVNSNTGSTAELVAQALKDYSGAKILGAPSAGALLQGVWYDLPEFGAGVSLSIPEALYQTKRGHIIEKKGVQLDKALEYRIKDFAQGQDSWILQSYNLF